MTKRKLGKIYSFTTQKHIETVVAKKTEYVELHFSKEELLRLIGAAVNSLNATPDADEFFILCWKKEKNNQCTVYPK